MVRLYNLFVKRGLIEFEAKLHFAEGNAVAFAEGLELVRWETLTIDIGAVHGVEVFDINLVAVAGQAEMAAGYTEVEAAVRAKINVRVAVALGVRAANDKLRSVGH